MGGCMGASACVWGGCGAWLRPRIDAGMGRQLLVISTDQSVPPAVLCPLLQADHLLLLYHGEWQQSVDPIYSPEFTY